MVRQVCQSEGLADLVDLLRSRQPFHRGGPQHLMASNDHVSALAGHFERAILSGALAPGDLLPSERDISARMGVSRSVVREALGRLASVGLVKKVRDELRADIRSTRHELKTVKNLPLSKTSRILKTPTSS